MSKQDLYCLWQRDIGWVSVCASGCVLMFVFVSVSEKNVYVDTNTQRQSETKEQIAAVKKNPCVLRHKKMEVEATYLD